MSKGADFATTIDFDNGGSLFTGRYRFNAGFDWFNPTGRGDVASLRAQVSTNLGTKFLRGSWLTPINSVGTKLGVAASFLKYELGSATFDSLDADGTAEAYSLQLLHPLVRSRNNNVFLQASTDYRRFEDRVNRLAPGRQEGHRPVHDAGRGRRLPRHLRRRRHHQLHAERGRRALALQDRSEADVDAANYQSAGNYAKLRLGASRLQVLPNKHYLYLSALAQLASKNLDSSEKFSMGGPYGVRAYPSPESPSDSGGDRHLGVPGAAADSPAFRATGSSPSSATTVSGACTRTPLPIDHRQHAQAGVARPRADLRRRQGPAREGLGRHARRQAGPERRQQVRLYALISQQF